MDDQLHGVIIGGCIALGTAVVLEMIRWRREECFRKKERRSRFWERQLNELYAPMLGLLKQIRALSDTRLEVATSRHGIVSEINTRIPRGEEGLKEAKSVTERAVAYENAQLREQIIPKYRQMADIFTQHYALAEPEMRECYGDFLRYVDIWKRFLDEDHPKEQLQEVEHDEDKNESLYQHIEQFSENLCRRIAMIGEGL